MNSKILVINAGSSSIKLQLLDKKELNVIASGLAERITVPGDGNITIKYNGQKIEKVVPMKDHKIAVEHILNMLTENKIINDPKEIELIGFRVVHGGSYITESVKLGQKEIDIIEKCKMYAPLHNPGALQAIKAFLNVMPHAKMSADFDTAFHTSIPAVNSTYPIPYEISEKYEIKRYGAHGISHEFITLKAQELLGKDSVNILSLHIGNGASICAIKDNKSIDTSMGLTPLAGIMMGSRSGDIDPSIHEFVMQKENLSISQFTDMLNKKSGMLGVSGISSDLRDILAAIEKGDERAKFAFDLYCQRIIDTTASYANKVGKIDAIIFTAGVGENTPQLRSQVIKNLNFANIEIDEELNNKPYDSYVELSTKNSDVKVFAVRTNEELLIAKHALKLYENE
ncbi:acetate/propionate family kinase [Mycoplasma tauri]|uniref:acetate/propionate family kinase n=1 Tax=Mycoplasma tauri TaxID=547987 RepID=UPI001CBB5C7D|nr:acetate/propionate family kinase [Mycoplasma tauri]MBZ4204147.1 acetate/propionate family kinase [Mycoplasma tauri]